MSRPHSAHMAPMYHQPQPSFQHFSQRPSTTYNVPPTNSFPPPLMQPAPQGPPQGPLQGPLTHLPTGSNTLSSLAFNSDDIKVFTELESALQEIGDDTNDDYLDFADFSEAIIDIQSDHDSNNKTPLSDQITKQQIESIYNLIINLQKSSLSNPNNTHDHISTIIQSKHNSEMNISYFIQIIKERIFTLLNTKYITYNELIKSNVIEVIKWSFITYNPSHGQQKQEMWVQRAMDNISGRRKLSKDRSVWGLEIPRGDNLKVNIKDQLKQLKIDPTIASLAESIEEKAMGGNNSGNNSGSNNSHSVNARISVSRSASAGSIGSSSDLGSSESDDDLNQRMNVINNNNNNNNKRGTMKRIDSNNSIVIINEDENKNDRNNDHKIDKQEEENDDDSEVVSELSDNGDNVSQKSNISKDNKNKFVIPSIHIRANSANNIDVSNINNNNGNNSIGSINWRDMEQYQYEAQKREKAQSPPLLMGSASPVHYPQNTRVGSVSPLINPMSSMGQMPQIGHMRTATDGINKSGMNNNTGRKRTKQRRASVAITTNATINKINGMNTMSNPITATRHFNAHNGINGTNNGLHNLNNTGSNGYGAPMYNSGSIGNNPRRSPLPDTVGNPVNNISMANPMSNTVNNNVINNRPGGARPASARSYFGANNPFSFAPNGGYYSSQYPNQNNMQYPHVNMSNASNMTNPMPMRQTRQAGANNGVYNGFNNYTTFNINGNSNSPYGGYNGYGPNVAGMSNNIGKTPANMTNPTNNNNIINNNNRMINVEELRESGSNWIRMRSLLGQVSSKLKELDSDKSGFLTFNEFEEFLKCYRLSKKLSNEQKHLCFDMFALKSQQRLKKIIKNNGKHNKITTNVSSIVNFDSLTSDEMISLVNRHNNEIMVDLINDAITATFEKTPNIGVRRAIFRTCNKAIEFGMKKMKRIDGSVQGSQN